MARLMLLLLFSLLVARTEGDNLLADLNPDLEIPVGDPEFHWFPHRDCLLETDTSSSYSGQSSIKVTNRSTLTAGPTLLLDNTTVQSNHSYHYSFYINFLTNPPDTLTFNMSVILRTANFESPTKHEFFRLANFKFQHAGPEWHRAGGDVALPVLNISDTRIYISMDKDVDFRFDSANLVELPRSDPVTWKNDIAAKIERERTNDITIELDVGRNKPGDLLVQVDMTSNAVLFGGSVVVDDFNRENDDFSLKYQTFFYDNFNAAVLPNALKWKQMEYAEGVMRTERVDIFLDTMNSHGIPVRAHTLLWGMPERQPHWLLNFTADPIGDPVEVRQEVNDWLKWFCEYYGKAFISYDVYNEYLKSQFYEDFFEDPDFIFDVFSRVENCTGDLYLNDYNVIRSGLDTTAVIATGKRLLDNGKRVQGIGAQAHVHPEHFDVIDKELLAKRVEELCSLGLPVTVSEFTVSDENVTARATRLDELLRFFYSEPCIIGVVYWGLNSENTNDPLWALTDGPDVVVNEAGEAWTNLVKGEWFTRETFVPAKRRVSHTFTGHHGDYSVTVTKDGETLHTSSFTLVKGQDVLHEVDL